MDPDKMTQQQRAEAMNSLTFISEKRDVYAKSRMCADKSLKRTNRIRDRYSFIKHKIEEGEVNVQYYPTTEMWSNVLNKPKNGTPFKKDRSKLMNVPLAYDDNVEF